MIWLHPLALIGLVALAAPIVIHLLVHRRAPRMPFPTLRFIRPTRLAAMRRQVLDDVPLLAARLGILAAAAAALAGPLLLTAARLAEYRQRTVRAVITTEPRGDGARRETAGAYADTILGVERPGDGIGAAVAWLRLAPPARREIVIVAPLTLGSVVAADVAMVPPDVGIRFVRTGDALSRADVDGGRTLGPLIQPARARASTRTVTLDANLTRVRETEAGDAAVPIQISAPAAAKPALAAAVSAVLSQRVWAPPDRRATLVVAAAGDRIATPAVDRVRTPWVADAIAAIGRDDQFQLAARNAASGSADDRLAREPWVALARAVDGRPAAAAAEAHGTLVVASVLPAVDLATPLLVRAVFGGLAAGPEPPPDILPIPETDLRAWHRDAPPPSVDQIRHFAIEGADDRRWAWGLVLALIVVETWMRRRRNPDARGRGEDDVEQSRVA